MGNGTTRFGSYELVRRLGAGGMAETFLAVRRGPGGFEQRVCLKRILAAHESDAEFVRLFLEEARLSAKLRHANIAQVLDFGVVDESHFLVLELIEGTDLKKLLAYVRRTGEPFPTGLASHIAFELGAALDFAHDTGPDGRVRGVVHRDISPSNVLLSFAGEVKLADFGIAKAMNLPGATRTGVIKGKVPYMAPEYAHEGHFDARADLFALGVLLYECVAGVRPFDGPTDLATLARVQKGEHVPLAERAPTAPGKLVEAIERLIRPNPDDRFPHATAFLDAMVDVAPPPTARRILGRLVRQYDENPNQPSAKEVLAFADTESAPHEAQGDGTVAHTGAGQDLPDPTPEVRPSGPDDPTRTRAPADRAATEVDRPGRRAPTAVARPPGKVPETRESTTEHATPNTTLVQGRTLPLGSTPPPEPTSRRRLRRDRALLGAMGVLLLAALGVLAFGFRRAADTEEPAATQAAQASASRARAPTSPENPPPQRRGAPPEAPSSETDLPVGEEPPAEEPLAVPETTDPAPQSAAARASSAPSPHRSSHKKRRAGKKTAALTVFVVPFGPVWLDGTRLGNAPVHVEIAPGTHVVATGELGPDTRKRIRLRAGEQREVILEKAR